jgi:acyl transferase domain-containing protein/acyl carrier protein
MGYAQVMVVEGERGQMRRVLLERPPVRRAAETQAVTQANQAPINLTDLQQQLRSILSAVVHVDPGSIDMDQSFAEFGLDSFLGVEMMNRINRQYGISLSGLKLFDYPTVKALSFFLKDEIPTVPSGILCPLAAVDATRPQYDQPPYPVLRRMSRAGRTASIAEKPVQEKIAIVGMSGRYPDAPDLKQYWNNLEKGRNSIREVPRSRWDVNRYYDPNRAASGRSYSKWLGALDEFDCFDPLFFRISPQEAEYMDPQHRLFLEEGYKAFEDAGYAASALSNRKCGVYLGISTNDYMVLLSRGGQEAPPVTSNSYAIAAARIAYYLNLKGPAMSVDTACSSSLVAMHLASQALLSREIEMALVGGVSLWLAPESYVAMSQAGMFSPVGQCKTFDDSADGIVNGEGVGAIVLKRLSDAEADGDRIYGVILGSGINQDGKTNGITAPSVNSQCDLERSIYDRHRINPETISYIETHGTGTKLGDPIELEALATVFKEKTNQKNFCALGSVKSNIGHTTAAAGIAGVQKVLLSMQHRTLAPTLNVANPTTRFQFAGSPFYVSREAKPWTVASGCRRRAAVSSFGFSGTNAHLVLEEYPAAPRVRSSAARPIMVPLSARTTLQLRRKAQDLLEFVNSIRVAGKANLELESLAYTLQVGREPMEQRLAMLSGSVDQLVLQLRAYLDGEQNIANLFHGHVETHGSGVALIARDGDMQTLIDRWISREKYAELLAWWVKGGSIDWNKLYEARRPRRMSLPTYPFAKERYWMSRTSANWSDNHNGTGDGDKGSIEDVIDLLSKDAIDTAQGIEMLNVLV